ncbi:helix-turn-helix domain-containing protein [Spirochaeta africana]|uniref:Helix-turn-helix protein n=1 Tax=Spirochaeta africana (strain ATCC 700263 / DSM 8902 / Z-7692) TaxID=889378 RepID=H9UGW4_SPIAZ|nr:RodZ domain-containing protein [Spirochaeta africana]AFG36757.1 Helix-turn-helix protein [Spirochaeta africana DSM 8902]
MESIGEKLIKARELKGYSLEQVARDTHISQRYIQALEQEAFELFPGETYLLGFIRKYADFLGMDPQEMVNLYKNQQLQEQPAPIQELLHPTPRVTGRMVGIAAGVLGVGAVALVIGLFASGIWQLPERETPVAEPTRNGQMVHLTQNFLEQRFFTGDAVSVPVEGVSRVIEIVEVGDAVVLETAGLRETVAFGDEVLLDLTADDLLDVRVRVVDDLPGSDRSAVLRIDRSLEGPERLAVRPGSEPAAQTGPIGATSVAARERETLVLQEPETVQPIRLQVTARDVPVLARLQTPDDQQQLLLQPGDSLSGEHSTWMQLSLGNAGAADILLNDQQVELGEPGEVRVVRFAWTNQFGPGNPRLEQVPVY